jgi:uncharacterized lipoprotein
MTKLLLSCIAACALITVLAGCSSTERQTTSTSTYDSSVSDSKDMHHR